MKKSHIKIHAYISPIESEIAELKSSGVKIQEAEQLLKQAKAELNENNFEQARELADKAKKVANERKAGYDLAFKSISEAEEIVSNVRSKGVVVSDKLLMKSKQAFDDGDYEEAIKHAKQSEETTKKNPGKKQTRNNLKLP